MGILDDIMAQDCAFAFTNPDLMPGTESITYRARNDPRTDKVVSANVVRHPLGAMPGIPNGQAVAPITVFISVNDIPTINTGGDQILLPLKIGAAARFVPVREIVMQDTGGWTLLIY